MRQTNQIDLRTQSGARTVQVVPGAAASVQYNINAQQSRIGGLFNYVRGIVINGIISVTRSAGTGMTPIWPDMFAAALGSISLNTPMDGTLIDPVVMNGTVAKNLHSFALNGYMTEGLNQDPILAASATVFKRFTLYLPFSQKWSPWPDQFARWLGWLNDGQLELFLNQSANPFGAQGSGGLDTINSVTFSAALDMVPWPEIIIPPHVVLRKYETPANASSNGPTLINVGTAGALQGVQDASRLVGMYFSHQAGGFIGSGTADQIQSMTLPWRNQDQTYLIDAIYARWLQASHKRPLLGLPTSGAAATDIFDTAQPYPMPNSAADSGATGLLNSANSRYTPIVWPEIDMLVSYLQKVKGNYPIDMLFSAAQSNVFRVYPHELKAISDDKASEYLSAMGINPTAVKLVPKLGKKNVKNVDPAKLWGVPQGVYIPKTGK